MEATAIQHPILNLNNKKKNREKNKWLWCRRPHTYQTATPERCCIHIVHLGTNSSDSPNHECAQHTIVRMLKDILILFCLWYLNEIGLANGHSVHYQLQIDAMDSLNHVMHKFYNQKLFEALQRANKREKTVSNVIKLILKCVKWNSK